MFLSKLVSSDCYNRVRELIANLRDKQEESVGDIFMRDSFSHFLRIQQSEIQTMLINTLIQAKAIGDKKMQLSQQMLDTTERQSKKLKIAYQKYSTIKPLSLSPSIHVFSFSS